MKRNMEQQGNLSKMDLPADSSISDSQESPDDQFHSSTMRPNNPGINAGGNKGGGNNLMIISKEELKICGELEDEIEMDLEAEIKDQICHLALRLHRLYQHQRERSAKSESSSNINGSSLGKENVFSEMNIRIRMEGGSKIEINETKKLESSTINNGTEIKGRPRTSISEVLQKQGKMQLKVANRDVNWVNTLGKTGKRSPISSNIASKKQDEAITRRKNAYASLPNAEGIRKNFIRSVSRQQNGEEMKLLELGWKS